MYVVTGASDGLGLALAKALVATGARVVSLSRSAPKIKGVDHIACDLTNEGSLTAAAAQLLQQKEPLTALVHAAGVYSEGKLGDLTGQELARVYTTNIIGPMLLTARLLERIKKDGADVVNISSTSGFKGNPDQAAYSSSKWALRGFSQNLKIELQGTPCRVISFCPGGMDTGIFKKAGLTDFDTSAWMQPDDIAAFMVQILLLPKNIEVTEVLINRKG